MTTDPHVVLCSCIPNNPTFVHSVVHTWLTSPNVALLHTYSMMQRINNKHVQYSRSIQSRSQFFSYNFNTNLSE